jgi:hypothetical protein
MGHLLVLLWLQQLYQRCPESQSGMMSL